MNKIIINRLIYLNTSQITPLYTQGHKRKYGGNNDTKMSTENGFNNQPA